MSDYSEDELDYDPRESILQKKQLTKNDIERLIEMAQDNVGVTRERRPMTIYFGGQKTTERLVVIHDDHAEKQMTSLQFAQFKQHPDTEDYEYSRDFSSTKYEILDSDQYVPSQYVSNEVNYIEDENGDLQSLISVQCDQRECVLMACEQWQIDSGLVEVNEFTYNKFTFLSDTTDQISLHPKLVQIRKSIMGDDHNDDYLAHCLQCIIVHRLGVEELTRDYIQQYFDNIQDHTRDKDLVRIAHVVIDSINWLAWRPLKYTKAIIKPECKVTTLKLDHKLFDISQVALVFKKETMYSGAGGIHEYVPHANIDQYLDQALQNQQKEQFSLHAVLGKHSLTVLDIDVKQEEFADEWTQVMSISDNDIQQTIDRIAAVIKTYKIPSINSVEPIICLYRTSTKLSVRAVLGIPMNVNMQSQILQALQSGANTNDFVYNVLVKSIDKNVHRRFASYRLPLFNKIADKITNGQKGKEYVLNRTFLPIRDYQMSNVALIKQACGIYVRYQYDVVNRDATPIPICSIRYTNSGVYTRVRKTDQNMLKQAVKAIIGTECDIVANNNSYKVDTYAMRSYCPLCEKQHAGDNQFQYMIWSRNCGTDDQAQVEYWMNCISRIGRSDNQFKLPTTAMELQYIKSEDELLEDFILEASKRQDKSNQQLSQQSKVLNKAVFSRTCESDFDSHYLLTFPEQNYKVICEQYLPLDVVRMMHNNVILAIRSPMGSGKTETLTNYIKKYSPNSVLWISTRKTYTLAMRSRLVEHTFASYNDEEHAGQNLRVSTERLLVQADSIGRCISVEQIDLLVLDEFMSILQQIEGKPSLFQKLSDLIKISTRVVILDAQLELSTYQVLLRTFTSPKPPYLLLNQYKPCSDRTLSIFNRDLSQPRLLDAVVRKLITILATQNVFMFVSSHRQQQDVISRLLDLGFQKGDILCINSETPNSVRDVIFGDVAVQTAKYKLMITTSTLTIGVDINTPHFTTAIGVFTQRCSSAQQFIQGLHRPRQLKHVYIFCEPDCDKAFVPTTHSISREVVIRDEMIIMPDPLLQYTKLYSLTLRLNPFSYITNVCQSMGYQLQDCDLEEAEDIRRPKHTKRSFGVCTEPYDEWEMTMFYAHYLNSIGNRDPVQEYQYEVPDFQPIESPNPELASFIEKAHIYLHQFSQRPATLNAMLNQAKRIRNAYKFLCDIQVDLQTLETATQAYHDGTFIRCVRAIVAAAEQGTKLTPAQLKPHVTSQLSLTNLQKWMLLTNKQQENLLDSTIRTLLPEQGSEVRRNILDYYSQHFKVITKSVSLKKVRQLVYIFDFRGEFPVYNKTKSDEYNQLVERTRVCWRSNKCPIFTCCQPDY